ncbi:uncharacterized protein [Clytia hemisphaerica]|uniref:uncharacterized protein n=1 Tax=Clytia hemisphaerica TaxID=252671 RepID=UPI0034D4A9B7
MEKPKLKWSRTSIEICYCDSLPGEHIHCPCTICENSAVSRSTEYNHWKLSQSIYGDVTSDNDSDNDTQKSSDNIMIIESDYYNPDDIDSEINQNSTFNETFESESDSIQSSEPDDTDESHENSSVNKTFESENNASESVEPIELYQFVGNMNNTSIRSSIQQSAHSTNGDNLAGMENTDGEEDPNDAVEIEKFVTFHVVKTMDLAAEMNASHHMTEKLLKHTGEILQLLNTEICDHWPSSYARAKSISEAGQLYSTPEAKAICFDKKEHPLHWYELDVGEPCPHCLSIPSLYRYYLPLKGKIIRWFSSETMCCSMLGHWKNKDSWLHKTGSTFPLNEIWDGSRFKEVQWFWDPAASWALPHQCNFCENIINMQKLNSGQNKVFTVTCDECQREQSVRLKYANGDPRNIALIGHWDGWQPGFGRGYSKGSGSIEVTIANMEKRERSKSENVFVTSFVPEHHLPNKQPTALDPYLNPLIDELVELFINGMEVDYPSDIMEGLNGGKFTVRCMLLCWTGDYPGHCQIGKFSRGGTHGCRLDKCKGESVDNSSTKYFKRNRENYVIANRWKERKLTDEYRKMYEIEMKPSIQAKLSAATDTGYTGLSLLYIPYKLYEFNYITDTTRDIMHLVALNLCKKLLKRIFETYITGASQDEFNEKMQNFPLTPDLQDGHCPKHIEKCNSWTAEEWHKFTFPMAEVLLIDLPDHEYHLIWLTARIVELLFHHRSGLTEQEVKDLDSICWRRLILLEEQIGPKQCVITCHNSIHIAQDILRFSHSDNHWVWKNERSIKRHKAVQTNFKNIEYTYAKAEIARETRMVHGKETPPWTHKEDDKNAVVSSLEGAKIYAWVCMVGFDDDPSTLIIFIGAGGDRNTHELDKSIADVTSSDGLNAELYTEYRSCYLPSTNTHLKKGSFVLFSDNSIGQLTQFILIKLLNGEPHKYVRAESFEKTNSLLKEFSIYKDAGKVVVKKASLIKRVVILYQTDEETYLCVDLKRPNFSFDYQVLS